MICGFPYGFNELGARPVEGPVHHCSLNIHVEQVMIKDTVNSPESEEAKALSAPRKFGLIVAAIWLQAIVIAFVVIQVGRISTPIAGWVERITRLLQ